MQNRNIISIPLSWRRQTSMKRRFMVFSSMLFLLIFVLGSAAFIFLMGRMLHDSAGHELMKTIELKRHQLEASVNSDIAIALKMAASPLIKQFFLNPSDSGLRQLAFEDIEGYRRIFSSGSLFWVNDEEKIFWLDGKAAYQVDPDDPALYWYNMTMYETEKYNFNIDYDPNLKVTNIWVNAPVFDDNRKPLGILGTGMHISDFVNVLYEDYSGEAALYFFNEAGEITGAGDIDYVRNKIGIYKKLGKNGEEIFAAAKKLNIGEIKYFETEDKKTVVALGSIPALSWYVVAVRSFTTIDSLKTSMTVLFAVMMFVIFSVFVVFNMFVARLLEPLYNIVRDITQISLDWDLKQHNQGEIETLGEFLNMTIIDSLTGIYNRRYFDGNMKKIIKSLSRTGGKLSVLLIDIDFFKNYNDAYGHEMGDNCLREVVEVLSQNLPRTEDFIARYGGEEFTVVLPNTDEKGAQLVADKLLKKMRERNLPHKKSTTADIVTISIGGTTGTVKHSQSGSDYFRKADMALYKSKHNGRNQYTFESLTSE